MLTQAHLIPIAEAQNQTHAQTLAYINKQMLLTAFNEMVVRHFQSKTVRQSGGVAGRQRGRQQVWQTAGSYRFQ